MDESELNSSEITEVIDLLDNLSGRQTGQGFMSVAEVRKAIENHAMKLAIEHYQSLGWEVTDVSARASFDLYCRKEAGEELRIEVKGTTSAGSQVWLTANEVEHARTHYPHVALAIVGNVELFSQSGGTPETSGGELIILEPWRIGDGQLKPLAYQYNVP